MDTLSLPIYLIEGDDILIFSSIGDVKMQLEQPLIRGDEIAYDAKGRLVKISTAGKKINVLPAEKDPMHSAELEASLRKYLIAKKELLAAEKTCDLKCLVKLSLKYKCQVTLGGYITSLLNRFRK